ncbi:WhiB family transcriptional regulator [Streptomyces sp. SAS_272]|uniref:WhiB family transcriptional regulator n=1 Tax=Streptomyces sp. SAS_272 TaxID=3412747 RepID=UPI00403C2825
METNREWELRAICRGYDPEMWFSISKPLTAEAKRLCTQSCPVREECLEAILSREAETAETCRAGIVAGLTGRQRAALDRARRREQGAVKKKPAKPKGAGRPLSPCGTEGGYQRHVRKKEPVDQACKDAHALAHREYRRTGSTRVPATR